MHGASANGVGGGVSCGCRGFHQRGACQCHIGLHAFGGKGGQQLALLYLVANAGVQLLHAQAVHFGTDDGFLPRHHVAVGAEFERQHAGLGLRQCHGQSGLDAGWGGFVAGSVGACGQQSQACHCERRQQQAQGTGLSLKSVHGATIG